jgi:hypothetical protein
MAKGPFMEYMRAKVEQAVINTYYEVQLATPSSKTENMAMLIHSIEFHPLALVDVAPANLDAAMGQVSKVSKTTIYDIADPDIIALYKSITVLNAVINGMYEVGTQKQTFDPPLLYPKANLYVGFNTVGFTTVKKLSVRIGYTLEKVSREDFISALVE